MRIRVAGRGWPALRRAATHPAVWSVPLMAGAALARRHAQAAALAVAVPLGVLLAGVTVAVAYPLARAREGVYFTTPALDDRVLVRALLCSLAAYPLYAAAGVGLGVLLGDRRRRPGPYGLLRRLLVPALVAGWCVATLTGLLQDDRFNAPYWLLWTVPPIAAGATIAMSGLSIDVQADPPVLVGDWGRGACVALLVSAVVYAVGLNLLGRLAERRRAVSAPPPRAVPDFPA